MCLIPKDFDEGIRIGKDNFVWVFNNKNSSTELSTILTPIGGLYSFDQFDVNDELSFEIPDIKDITFAMLPNNFQFPFLSHELCINEQVVVPAGMEKLIIKSECATELATSDYCLVEGCVMWDIIDGVRLSWGNAIHTDLTLVKIDSEGDYILKYPGQIDEKKWKGLSGSPVFSDKCRLVGMIIRVSPNDSTVRVVPMKKITNLMDYAIKYEQSLKH